MRTELFEQAALTLGGYGLEAVQKRRTACDFIELPVLPGSSGSGFGGRDGQLPRMR